MGNLVFQATLGGQVNLVGPNTASTFNLNVPAVSSTLATLTGTETFTNKTLTSPTLTTPVLGTPSSGTLTNCTGLPNAGLVNSSVTIGGTAIALGASSSTITNDLSISGLTVGKGGSAVVTNTAVGGNALNANTTGNTNTAIGFNSLTLNTTGTENTGIGTGALESNTTGVQNTGIGREALDKNTTANGNTAVGYRASYSNTTGTQNASVGQQSLNGNTTGSSNSALGYQALLSNTTASRNTAVGYQAGYTNTVGTQSTYIGAYAGYNATGTKNTFVGDGVGYAVTTGTNNTFIGVDGGSNGAAGGAMTTGSKNTIIGGYSGNQGGLDIRTSSNYIVLSDGDGNPRLISNGSGTWYAGNASPIGNNSAGFMFQQNGELHLANANGSEMECLSSSGIHLYFYTYNGSTRSSAGNISSNGGTTSYNGTSDYRLKENIAPLTGALATVSQLKPVTFTWKGDNRNDNGFIAHELQEVLPNAVTGEKDAVNSEGNPIYQGIDPRNIVATLTAAIQELKAEFDAYVATHP